MALYYSDRNAPVQPGQGTATRPQRQPFQQMPVPWTFLTSGYFIGFLIFALVSNRIQEIVTPPRLGPRRHRNRDEGTPYGLQSQAGSVWSRVFPIDLSSTLSRTIIRLPTSYLLLKSLSIWTIIVLQAFHLFPTTHVGWLHDINTRVGRLETGEVCWSTFIAVCAALCINYIASGLEGLGRDASPFNLFGYAFLLHLYSSPGSNVVQRDSFASRPTKHYLIPVTVPLLQITMIHLLGMRESWSRQRLIPTTMCTAITMTHFHSVFWRSPTSYPLFNYFPVLLESFLIASTILVCILDVLTQILLEGTVARTILCRSGSLMPRWEEDCSVVITRLGTASLEATSIAGLGNEVAGVTTNDPTAMELDRAGVSSSGDLVHGRQRGFLNEVKNIKAVSMRDRNHFEHRSLFSKELERYFRGWLRVIKGTWILLRYGRRSQRPIPSIARDGEEVANETISAERDEGDYRRFLLGEAISDDEDEYHYTPHTPSSGYLSLDEEDDNPVELYHNLTSGETSADPVPVLLAHMVNSSSFPLTRRRYQGFIASAGQHGTSTVEPPVDPVASNLRRRWQSELSEEEGWDESRMNCVICTARPRQVICWPCRCLALCNDCRENLALRSSASNHSCPCCRRRVEGFSRIYIP
ncbi:hypothetical protein BDM02DRAFT_3088444 [Thelephora ganbajun]|uniref:Uncharacterized protein n=1 Tax=Thelephora ganbajun TaxID=370292 RepID=A0ACB6ZTH9_THEGA|nr:hypothetical protein BDM02DRAFT_3088444 [Thelephora ganbajun]